MHAGSALSSATCASTSAWVAVAGRSTRIEVMPTSAQSLCLPLTYHRDPGSSPTEDSPEARLDTVLTQPGDPRGQV